VAEECRAGGGSGQARRPHPSVATTGDGKSKSARDEREAGGMYRRNGRLDEVDQSCDLGLVVIGGWSRGSGHGASILRFDVPDRGG
jgi:hypothetical protein